MASCAPEQVDTAIWEISENSLREPTARRDEGVDADFILASGGGAAPGPACAGSRQCTSKPKQQPAIGFHRPEFQTFPLRRQPALIENPIVSECCWRNGHSHPSQCDARAASENTESTSPSIGQRANEPTTRFQSRLGNNEPLESTPGSGKSGSSKFTGPNLPKNHPPRWNAVRRSFPVGNGLRSSSLTTTTSTLAGLRSEIENSSAFATSPRLPAQALQQSNPIAQQQVVEKPFDFTRGTTAATTRFQRTCRSGIFVKDDTRTQTEQPTYQLMLRPRASMCVKFRYEPTPPRNKPWSRRLLATDETRDGRDTNRTSSARFAWCHDPRRPPQRAL